MVLHPSTGGGTQVEYGVNGGVEGGGKEGGDFMRCSGYRVEEGEG